MALRSRACPQIKLGRPSRVWQIASVSIFGSKVFFGNVVPARCGRNFPFEAMVSIRSEAFLARMVELGLEDCIGAFKSRNLTTFARYAFGCEYNPLQAGASILTEQLFRRLAGENADMIPLLRMSRWDSWGGDSNGRDAESSDGTRRQAEEAGATRD